MPLGASASNFTGEKKKQAWPGEDENDEKDKKTPAVRKQNGDGNGTVSCLCSIRNQSNFNSSLTKTVVGHFISTGSGQWQ